MTLTSFKMYKLHWVILKTRLELEGSVIESKATYLRADLKVASNLPKKYLKYSVLYARSSNINIPSGLRCCPDSLLKSNLAISTLK